MHIEILVEDSSGRRLLEHLVPKLLGSDGAPHTWRIHPYRGIGRIPPRLSAQSDPARRILLDQLPRLLRGYAKTPGIDAVVIVLDADNRNCSEFLDELKRLAQACGSIARTLFRIAIEEMEAWYFGDKEAVLLGDIISSLSTSKLYKLKNMAVLEKVTNATSLVCEGEIQDVLDSYNCKITEKKYFDTIRKKTAVLFSLSTELGSYLAGAAPGKVLALKKYGLNAGMAFQIVDDILDFTEKSSKLGKPVFSDIIEGKLTLPVIIALKEAAPKDRKKLIKIIVSAKKHQKLNKTKIKEFRKILEKYDTITKSYLSAEKFAEKAVNDIKRLPDNKFKKALTETAQFIIKRKY